MDKILLVGLAGALVTGTAFALYEGVNDKVQKKNKNLNYKWKNLRTDKDLAGFVSELGAFSKYDPISYQKIGSLLDEMIQLWNHANDPSSSSQFGKRLKFNTIKTAIGSRLIQFSDRVVQLIDETPTSEMDFEEKKLHKDKFCQLAENIHETAKAYAQMVLVM